VAAAGIRARRRGRIGFSTGAGPGPAGDPIDGTVIRRRGG
jgi:hypothetical protein